MNKKIYASLTRWIWVILVFTLPVTSMPLVVMLSGSDSVAPLSGLLLFFLFIVWFIPYIVNNGSLTTQSIPLLLFTVSVIISTLLVSFRVIPPFKDVSMASSILKSVFTIFIGIAFFIIASSFLGKTKLFDLTRKIINWSGLLVIIWSVFQVSIYSFQGSYFEWMHVFQRTISTSDFFQNRATGFALEPSWLAHQLNLLYLPCWLAASVTRNSAHQRKIRFIIFEDFLLIGGALTLMLSLSRVGIIAFVLMLGYLFIRLNFMVEKWIETKLLSSRENLSGLKSSLFRIPFFIILGVIYVGLLLVVIQIFQRFDPRMATLFTFSDFSDNVFLRYANSLRFGERIVYWLAAWEVFGQYPLLGVGLGMAGYYFPQNITGYGWTLYEVRMLVYRSTGLLNAKSLWFRILSETGILGFSLFLGWLFTIGYSSYGLIKSRERKYKYFGWVGAFFLIGLFVEGFSIDSFALPFLWFSAALISASSFTMIQEKISLLDKDYE